MSLVQAASELVLFHPTKITGVVRIELEPVRDDRGFFARSWCREEFARNGLSANLAQCNVSGSRAKGTLRGLHFQEEPHAEAKLIRCTRGAIFDVAVDLRRNSATFRQWVAAELTSTNHWMLYVPEGCAHGFLTLEDDCEVFYQMSRPYHPEAGRGVRWNDPAFAITWPGEVRVISVRDAGYPDFEA